MDPASQVYTSALVLFGALGVLLWGWLVRRLGHNWVDLVMDPRGFLSMLLVICVATGLLGMMVVEGLRQLAVYLARRPLLLGALGLTAIGVICVVSRRRRTGWDA